jgi:ComF family protein
MTSTVRFWLNCATDTLFPSRCLSCRSTEQTDGLGLCGDCRGETLVERSVPSCPRCGASVAEFEVHEGRCGHCRDLRLRVDRMARVGPYSGTLLRLLRAYKYHRHEPAADVLGAWLLTAVRGQPWLDQLEAIVPVPTHWTRRIWRPYYPADVLAQRLAAELKLPLAPLLRRVRAGPRQVGLSHTARVQNVRGAFSLRRGIKLDSARLLLVDDVRTTGATLEECAKVLTQGGAAQVYGAVVVTVGWQHLEGQPIDLG